LATFRQKIWAFLKKQSYDKFFAKISSSLNKKRQYCCQMFGENILRIT
jgi:hypothetical protein